MNDHITFYFKFESINLFGLETLFVLHCVCVSCYGFFNGYSPVYHTSPFLQSPDNFSGLEIKYPNRNIKNKSACPG